MSTKLVKNADPFSLSVVVPNFNDGKYLKRCLDSVCSQTILPNELIILDDASTDNSVKVINEAIYKYPFAKLIQNAINLGGGGVFNANKGLYSATGKYVLFLGANDLILPGLIQKIKESLEANPKAGLFSAMVWLIDEKDKYLHLHPSPILSLSEKFINPAECLKILETNGSWLTGQTTVYRREALIAAGGFDPSLGGLCDLLAAQVVACRLGAVFSPTPLAVMRLHSGAFLVDTLADSKKLESVLDEVTRKGVLSEPRLFTLKMLQRTKLRFYFSSLRLSLGSTTTHIQGKVNWFRRYALKLTQLIPVKLLNIRLALYFVIMRPFDILPFLYYRGLAYALIFRREKKAGRCPPNY